MAGDKLFTRISPEKGVERGQVRIECTSFQVSEYTSCQIRFGGVPTCPTIVTSKFLVAEIPVGALSGPVTLSLAEKEFNGLYFEVARRIASDLHCVGNPCFDIDGNLLLTFSGTLGQKVPVTVFKLDPAGEVRPFISDITNPTGLTLGPDGNVYITSRSNGSLYQVSRKGEIKIFAQGLGAATGLAIDKEGDIFVGDRAGTIFKVDESGSARAFVSLPASVAAFHLAFGPEGDLYVTGPTLATRDSVFRITPKGEIKSFFTGLNRPQGLTIDESGSLYVVAYLAGQGGVVKITPKGEASLAIAGANLVGLIFDKKGNLILTSNQAAYRLPLGVKGL